MSKSPASKSPASKSPASKSPTLPPALRRELTEHFRADIAETSALIGRNLDRWL